MIAQKPKAEPTVAADRIRFQLELSPSVMEKLDKLVSMTDSASRAEAIRRALGIYYYLVAKAKEGKSLEITGGKERERLVLEGVDT
jgi:metal-responsive CopG/Arc/MetJ family transcriptional regulator